MNYGVGCRMTHAHSRLWILIFFQISASLNTFEHLKQTAVVCYESLKICSYRIHSRGKIFIIVMKLFDLCIFYFNLNKKIMNISSYVAQSAKNSSTNLIWRWCEGAVQVSHILSFSGVKVRQDQTPQRLPNIIIIRTVKTLSPDSHTAL